MTAAMELLHPASCLLLLLLFLLTRPGVTSADNNGAVKVKVKEGDDVVLPCSLRQTDLTYQMFDWTKVEDDEDKTQNVFLYDAGKHYNNNGRPGQDPQFKGRVSHFEDELQHGNASIKIQNTKLEDRGNYKCIFPNIGNQIFPIELVVGAATEPSVATIDETADRALLECAVRGAFPKPTVEWKNSAGEVLPSVVTHDSEVNERFDITLQTNVTQTGYYSCVVTQYDIGHQVYTKTFVRFAPDSGDSTGWILAAVLSVVVIIAAGIIVVLRIKYRRTKHSLKEIKKGSHPLAVSTQPSAEEDQLNPKGQK